MDYGQLGGMSAHVNHSALALLMASWTLPSFAPWFEDAPYLLLPIHCIQWNVEGFHKDGTHGFGRTKEVSYPFDMSILASDLQLIYLEECSQGTSKRVENKLSNCVLIDGARLDITKEYPIHLEPVVFSFHGWMLRGCRWIGQSRKGHSGLTPSTPSRRPTATGPGNSQCSGQCGVKTKVALTTRNGRRSNGL